MAELDDDDAFDLDAVEAELARMQQRRMQRIHAAQLHRHTLPERQYDTQTPAVTVASTIPLATTAGFELNEAELSAGTESEDDSSDSSDQHQYRSTVSSAHKPSRRRLVDSLDLSMSIADVPAPPVRATRTHSKALPPPTTTTTMKVPPLVHTQQHAEPEQQKQDEVRVLQEASTPETESRSSERNNQSHLTTAASAQQRRNEDSWTSNLVRRRRQLEKDAVQHSTRRDRSPARDARTSTAPSTPPAPSTPSAPSAPLEHAAQSRLPSSSLSQTQGHSASVRAPLPRTSSLDDTCRDPDLIATPAATAQSSALQTNSSSNQRLSGAKQTHHALPPSSLKLPAQYGAKSSSAATSALRSTRMTPYDASTTMTRDQSTPSSALRNNKSIKGRSEPEDYTNDDQDDDDDLVSAEEERLRQSLAKLDSRLTKLSAAMTRQQHQHRDERLATKGNTPATERPPVTAPVSGSSTTATTSDRVLGHTRDKHAVAANDEAENDDRSAIAAAAYGGGAHCKSGQVTTALERASYSRRIEMSSGTHKLRVRPGGGALTHDSSSTDKDAKHKVVVKKDLAHLLF